MTAQILAVPNWSFGRSKTLLREVGEELTRHPVEVHYCESDLDHNRTVTAFSGETEAVHAVLLALADLILPAIDLNRHAGVHPRIGGLDVCPIIPFGPEGIAAAIDSTERLAAELAGRHHLPIFLYEKSEKGRHEATLPELRTGGFGGLFGRELQPDFGPREAHPNLGATILGVRDFLIALNVNLLGERIEVAREIASKIRRKRSEGDPRFLGVRALGLPLASRQQIQVSMNLTLPDITSIDPILQWVWMQAMERGVALSENELIGVIRPQDLLAMPRLPHLPAQVVKIGNAV